MDIVYPSRRDLFRLGGGALVMNSMLSQSQAQAGALFTKGKVTNSETGEGISGVRVSNGCDIVLTDITGLYEIPLKDDAPIFVIKPSGWTLPINKENMLPSIHKRPDIHGVVDFSLTKIREPGAFDVLMFADPQPANDLEMSYLRAQITQGPIASSAAFGITLGDLVGDDLSLFDRYNAVISQIGVPWWNLPGNHDLDFSAASATEARAPWRRVYGPTTYAFEYGPATFIMLDNIHWKGQDTGSNKYCGLIGQENLRFIKSLLETTPKDRLVILCMHIPLVSANDPDDQGSMTLDRDELLALIGDRPCVSFAGHMHTTEHHYLPLPDGGQHHHHIMTALSGSWWSGPMDTLGQPVAQSCDGNPNGWHVLSIDGSDYSTRFVSSREPAQLRIMLLSDSAAQPENSGRRSASSSVAQDELGHTKILVNIFDGGPRTKVEACVAGCSPSVVSRSLRPDPLAQDLFQSAGITKKPWVRAEPSSHIWETELPRDLRPGLHRLNVSVRNEYGTKIHGAFIFEVTKS